METMEGDEHNWKEIVRLFCLSVWALLQAHFLALSYPLFCLALCNSVFVKCDNEIISRLQGNTSNRF